MVASTWHQKVAGIAALFAAAFIIITAMIGAAAAADIRVPIDQAVPVRLAAPAEGVAVGNPSIAGVSVQDDQLIFITGRSYGTTNLVIVGANGRVLYSGRITVTPDEGGSVMVTRGTQTARLECTPLCRPHADIGDANAESLNEQLGARASAASSGR